MEPKPADLYQPVQPSTGDLMDCIRDNARNLSDAIKNAKKAGVSVSIQLAPEGSDNLIQIVYSF